METKKINPLAIVALKDALSTIYWYKKDLKLFLTNTLTDQTVFLYVDWEDYKRNIVDKIINLMVKNTNKYYDDLINLMLCVADIEDFTHLKHLEDGKLKIQQAHDAVKKLRRLTVGFELRMKEEIKSEENKKRAQEQRDQQTAIRGELDGLRKAYCDLIVSNDPQRRGYELEKLFINIFTLFDLDPKASFKIVGEQIDGAFSFDNADYLFEAKWVNSPVQAKDLDSLTGKLQRKLDNTLGLFLSINGYSDEAVSAHSSGRRLLLLMDGADLMAVLETRIDLKELLLRKRRHASQTGNIYLKISEILK